MEVFIFGGWRRSRQSLAPRVYVFSDSVLCLGKMNENPQSNVVWEDKLTWFKRSSQYRALDTIDGEPTEFEWSIFPGFTTLQLCSKVQELLSRLSVEPEKITGRIIFMSMFNDISCGSKDNKKNAIQVLSSFLSMRKDFSKTMVIPLTWIRKEMVFYSWIQSTRRMGQNCRADDVNICRKQTPSLPIHESIIQRSAQKQRWWNTCQNTIALTRERLKLFFAQLFPSISSVFTEQSQICAKNVTPSMLEQGDLLWQDHLTHCSCQVWWKHTYLWPMIMHNKKQIYCKDIKNELKSYHIKTQWENFVLMQDSWPQLKSDSISQLTDSVTCREYTLPREEKLSEPKGWIRRNTRLDPYWKSQPAAHKVNMEWKSELCLKAKTLLTRGSEFLMAWTSWSRTWTTTSRKPRTCSSKTMRWNWMQVILRADRRLKQNHKDISANSTTKTIPIGERTWTDIEPQDYSPTNYSVSKKLINLLRHGSLLWEDDGAIEFWRIKRLSSEPLCAFSALVW